MRFALAALAVGMLLTACASTPVPTAPLCVDSHQVTRISPNAGVPMGTVQICTP